MVIFHGKLLYSHNQMVTFILASPPVKSSKESTNGQIYRSKNCFGLDPHKPVGRFTMVKSSVSSWSTGQLSNFFMITMVFFFRILGFMVDLVDQLHSWSCSWSTRLLGQLFSCGQFSMVKLVLSNCEISICDS